MNGLWRRLRRLIDRLRGKDSGGTSGDTRRWGGKRNVLVDPGNLIVWMTPEASPKRVYQYDSGYYDPRSMDPATVAERHWTGFSNVATRAGHPQFTNQARRPVAYTVEVLSWFNPNGVRAPDVTLHEMFYDGGYSLRFEVGNSRDHFGRPGTAHGDVIAPDGAVIASVDVNHSRETSLRY